MKIVSTLFLFRCCLISCGTKSTESTLSETDTIASDTRPLMLDAGVTPGITSLPLNKIYENNDFGFTYPATCFLIEQAMNHLDTPDLLYELTVKRNDSNLLYITINRGDCDYKAIYETSISTYTDGVIAVLPMSDTTISNIKGKYFRIIGQDSNITIYIIPTKHHTIIFQLFSDNETSFTTLNAIINSFWLKKVREKN